MGVKRLFPDQAGLKVLAANHETAEHLQFLMFLFFLWFSLVRCLVRLAQRTQLRTLRFHPTRTVQLCARSAVIHLSI